MCHENSNVESCIFDVSHHVRKVELDAHAATIFTVTNAGMRYCRLESNSNDARVALAEMCI